MFKLVKILSYAALVALGVGQSAQAYTWKDWGVNLSGPLAGATSLNASGLGGLLSGFAAYSSFEVIGGVASQTGGRFTRKTRDGWGAQTFIPYFAPPGVEEATEEGRLGGGEALEFQFNNYEFRAREITLQSFYEQVDGAPEGDADQEFAVYVKALGSNDFTEALRGTISGSNETTFSLLDATTPCTSTPNNPCGIAGSVFVVVSLSAGDGNRGFTVKNFIGSAYVPLPPSAAILGGALLAGGFVARRRRKAA